jgi:hypothetical protein
VDFSRQPHARDRAKGRGALVSGGRAGRSRSDRDDICEITRAPFCAPSFMPGGDAIIAAGHELARPGCATGAASRGDGDGAALTDPHDSRLTLRQRVTLTLDPDFSASPSPLLTNADRAMYLAKREGRDRVSSFGPGGYLRPRCRGDEGAAEKTGISSCPLREDPPNGDSGLDSQANLHRIR